MSQYIRPKVTVHKCLGIVRMRVLFDGGPYMRKYGNLSIILISLVTSLAWSPFILISQAAITRPIKMKCNHAATLARQRCNQVHRTLDTGKLNSYLVDLGNLEKNSHSIWPHCEKGELSRDDHRQCAVFQNSFPFSSVWVVKLILMSLSATRTTHRTAEQLCWSTCVQVCFT